MKNIKKIILDSYVRTLQFITGIKRKTVVFVSFNGKSYSDNPRSVSEALHELAPDARIVWAFKDPQSKKNIVPSYVECVNIESKLKYCGLLGTAGVVVTNFTLHDLPKHKKQLLIQTWHGDKAFKKVLYDSIFAGQAFYVPEEKPGYCDLAVAGSEYGKHQYESAFHYNGKVLMEGTPRNDRLLANDPKLIQSLRKALNISQNTRVLLYAPTLRREAGKTKQKQQIQNIDLAATLNLLERRDGCAWCCLMRAHPAMVGLSGATADERIVEVSDYEDMADLLLISDMLITDYSSCAGDFALMKRPLVLYQADRQEYLEKDRTFYFDMEDSPYLIAETQKDLEMIISQLTPEKATENCEQILKFYGDCETGHASQSVAKIILDWINKK